MNSERRYSEEEVSQILDRATEAQTTRRPTSTDATGLTLRELHEIGREVGIPDDVLSQAAASLDTPRPVALENQSFLGQTIGVGRTVDFPRPLTDQEWHRLVVDLRETFDAKGKIREEGAFRQWTNSNLQALLEPTGSGERLRLKTLKGSARSFQGVGAGFMASGIGLGIAQIFGMASDWKDIVTFSVMGAGFFLASRLTVPVWAKTRARQFEQIIERATLPTADHRLPGESSDEDG